MGADGIRRLLARAQSWAALPFLAAATSLLIAVVFLGHEIEHHISAIEAWITHLGPWGALAFVGLFAFETSLLLPESLLSMIAGALFGMRWGVAVVVAGSLLAGALQYTLSRRLLRRRIFRYHHRQTRNPAFRNFWLFVNYLSWRCSRIIARPDAVGARFRSAF